MGFILIFRLNKVNFCVVSNINVSQHLLHQSYFVMWIIYMRCRHHFNFIFLGILGSCLLHFGDYFYFPQVVLCAMTSCDSDVANGMGSFLPFYYIKISYDRFQICLQNLEPSKWQIRRRVHVQFVVMDEEVLLENGQLGGFLADSPGGGLRGGVGGGEINIFVEKLQQVEISARNKVCIARKTSEHLHLRILLPPHLITVQSIICFYYGQRVKQQ